jgi:hypothetical protein
LELHERGIHVVWTRRPGAWSGVSAATIMY